jgi:hypothetical protein
MRPRWPCLPRRPADGRGPRAAATVTDRTHRASVVARIECYTQRASVKALSQRDQASLVPGPQSRRVAQVVMRRNLAPTRLPVDVMNPPLRRVVHERNLAASTASSPTAPSPTTATVLPGPASAATAPNQPVHAGRRHANDRARVVGSPERTDHELAPSYRLYLGALPHLHGGPAPVRRFLPELIDLIWTRRIDPGKVFDLELPLDEVAAGYEAMDQRRAIKVLLHP